MQSIDDHELLMGSPNKSVHFKMNACDLPDNIFEVNELQLDNEA